MFAFTDKYQKTKARSGGSYWRFNVYFEGGAFGFISLGWRYQNDKVQPPYSLVSGKFYTNFHVSREVAKTIYRDVIRRVGELEGRTIPFNEKHWKAPIIGQTTFLKTLPAYYEEKYGKAGRTEDDEMEDGSQMAQEQSPDDSATSSPYPSRLTYEAMQDVSKRPSWIPERIRFVGLDDKRLPWGKGEWEEQERKMAAIRASD